MNETPQEYTQRIIGYLGGSDPVRVLASTPVKIAKLLKGATRQRLAKRPEPGKWSVVEILAHLADSETVVGYRIRLVLGFNGVTIQAFDQDAWAKYSNYAKHDPKLSFEAYRSQRERTVRLLKKLSPELWENYGMHTERGKETVRRIVEMLAGHDINHVAQIETMLGKGKQAAKSKKYEEGSRKI